MYNNRMEIWKPVVHFEGYYEVSDRGRVRRIAPWCDGRKTKPADTLKCNVKQSGYVRVSLHREGVISEFAVHRLVMAAFVGPLPPGHDVNHKNGEKADNRVENLEYLTKSENQLHSYRVLGTASRPGSKHHNAKLTEDGVVQARILRSNGYMVKDLAIRFGVSQPTMSAALNGTAWRHVSHSPIPNISAL